MAIDIKTQSLFPVRRDKQIASSITYGKGSGGGGGVIDASIDLSNYALISYVDSSLLARDLNISYLESSINNSYDAAMFFIPEVSLNDSYFKWIGGYLEPSIASGGTGDVTKLYVDGSLAVRDARIAAINASLGDEDNIISYVNSSTYYDASLNAKANANTTISYKTTAYTLTGADNNCVIEASGTFGIYLPRNLLTGFQALIMNVGGGTITINASTGATVYTRDSSNDLTKRWTGATVYKRDSTSWAAMGDLQ